MSRYIPQLVTHVKQLMKNRGKKKYFFASAERMERTERATTHSNSEHFRGDEGVIKLCDIFIVWKYIHFLATTAVTKV